MSTLLQPVGEAAPIGAALAGLPHLPPVPGGATRQDSVRAGLEALAPHAPDIVLVHDAARPLIPPDTIPALLAALDRCRRRDPRRAGGRHAEARGATASITETVPRDGLFRPRRRRRSASPTLLARPPRRASSAPPTTPRCWKRPGERVAVVAGSDDNIKLTYPEDLARLERVMAGSWCPRVGTGFDVHVLEAGRPLLLCGVAGAARQGPGRPFRRRCRHPCAVRRDLWRAGRGRYRPALPAQRGDLEGRRQRPVPGATPPSASPRAAGGWPMPTSR